jgi:hypothetical protein
MTIAIALNLVYDHYAQAEPALPGENPRVEHSANLRVNAEDYLWRSPVVAQGGVNYHDA